MSATSTRPLCLVTGASGFLGASLAPALKHRFDLVCISRSAPPGSGFRFIPVDLSEPASFEDARVNRLRPEIVLHAAVASARLLEENPDKARVVNERATEWLCSRFESSCRRFVFCSTDLVFDGHSAPYQESNEPSPISDYGRSKHAGERLVAELVGEHAVIARLALLYGWGPQDRRSFLASFLGRAMRGESTELFVDEWRSPLYVEDAAQQLAQLCEFASAPPVVHLAGDERCTRYEMGQAALAAFGLDASLGVATRQADRPELGARPPDVTLDSSLARSLGLHASSLAAGFTAMRSAGFAPPTPDLG